MENYKYIQDKLNDDKIVFLDGATSSELEKNGVKMDEIGWAAPSSITNPAVLQNVHKNYINAGADIITTNTFSSARHVLENSLTYKDKVNEINIKAVECAILARNQFSDKKICIAGSLSLSYVADIVKGKTHDLKFRRDHYGSYDPDVIFKNFEEQVSIFKKYNIDLILLEMIIDPFICKPAIEAALASDLPVWLGFSCGNQNSDGDLLAFESNEMKFSESLKMINDSFDAVLLMHSEVKNITKGKIVTAFLDRDRGGDMNLQKLMQIVNVDFIAEGPKGEEVENLKPDEIFEALNKKNPVNKQIKVDKTETKTEVKNTEVTKYKKYIDEVDGTLEAILLDKKNKSVDKIPVSSLVEKMSSISDKKIVVIIFDGVITQRLIDISETKGVKVIVGNRQGNIKNKTKIETLVFGK